MGNVTQGVGREGQSTTCKSQRIAPLKVVRRVTRGAFLKRGGSDERAGHLRPFRKVVWGGDPPLQIFARRIPFYEAQPL